MPSIYQLAVSEADRRERYVAFSLRSSDRQSVTLLKLASIMEANAQELGSVDSAIDSYNSRSEIVNTKYVIAQPTASVRT